VGKEITALQYMPVLPYKRNPLLVKQIKIAKGVSFT